MLAFLAVTMGLPLFFLLIGSFNLAPPGKAAVYGFDNWVRAFSDPGTLSALWMSFLTFDGSADSGDVFFLSSSRGSSRARTCLAARP